MASKWACALQTRGVGTGDKVGILIADIRRLADAISGVLRAGSICVVGQNAISAHEVVLVLTESTQVDNLNGSYSGKVIATDSTLWLTEIMSVGDADEVGVSEQDLAAVLSDGNESGESSLTVLTRKQVAEIGVGQIAARVMVQ